MKDYEKLADELLPKKKDCAYNKKWQSTYPKDCQNIGYNQARDDCKPVVMKLLKEIDRLKGEGR